MEEKNESKGAKEGWKGWEKGSGRGREKQRWKWGESLGEGWDLILEREYL